MNEASSEVFIAAITSVASLVGVVVTAWLAYRAKSVAEQARDKAGIAADGISNNHDSNIRDDIDSRFNQLDDSVGKIDERMDRHDEALRAVGDAVTGVQTDIRGIRRDVGRATDLAIDAERMARAGRLDP